ncbi:carboxylesterase/lipase family protein [Okibacterium endophyticum]
MVLTYPATDAPERLDAQVTGGTVRGVREGSLAVWRGIPYAAAPVDEWRFRAPQPVRPWDGVLDCTAFGRVAVQAYRGQFRGIGPRVPSGEDCLSLNVVRSIDGKADQSDEPTTATTGTTAKAVMVFIHGGGYASGSSRDFFGGVDGFVQGGEIVYVSINYRLGALGYLDVTRYSTPDRPFESNLGLRDQVAALEWVRENISAFGGDPDNVTIFGESAGGNAVTTLMATPAAAGLFARAIAQSSPPHAVYGPELTAEWAGEFIEALRTTVGDAETDAGATHADPVTLLTTAQAPDLVAAALTLQHKVPDTHPGTFPFAPVVDGDFLPEYPIDAFRAGRAHRVPLIIGTNDREGSVFRGRIDILPRSADRIRSLIRNAPPESRPVMREAYPRLLSPRGAADFAGDYAFWYPSVKVADFHSRHTRVHSYRFDVAPRLLQLVGLDATHGLEMYALFNHVDVPLARAMTVLGGRDELSEAGQRMRDFWIRFAVGHDLEPEWPAYGEPLRLTNIMGETNEIVADPRRARRQAWEAFLPLGE